MPCPLPHQLPPPPWAPPRVVGRSMKNGLQRGQCLQSKASYFNARNPFLAAEGCRAGSLHLGKGEAFWGHQRDYSCGSSPEPSSLLNIFPASLKPRRLLKKPLLFPTEPFLSPKDPHGGLR